MRSYHTDKTLPNSAEIFVFGSNLAGIHGAGAAVIAHKKFGAIWGKGEGLHGNSFAIPTKDRKIITLPFDEIMDSVFDFVLHTHLYHNQKFWVTRVGCGLAGLKDEQVAPLFKDAINCSFAEGWRKYLEL